MVKYSFDQSLNYNPLNIQAPLLFQYALGVPQGPKSFFYVEGGLQGNLQINRNESLVISGIREGVFSLSLPIGAGLQIPITTKNKLILGTRYYRFTSFGSNRIQVFSATAGITL